MARPASALPSLTSAQLASQNFLLEWDPTLAGAVEQLGNTMRSCASNLDRVLPLFNLRELEERATELLRDSNPRKSCTGAHLLAIGGYNTVQSFLGMNYNATNERHAAQNPAKSCNLENMWLIWGIPSSASARDGREFVMEARIKDLGPKRDIPGYESLFEG
ncbi:hypothetical protein DFH06DRAFT_1299242 [Mycena polygramma]|nr:hypothetical protein DFH06DRAFT_1299242 [Mycena polygramma]